MAPADSWEFLLISYTTLQHECYTAPFIHFWEFPSGFWHTLIAGMDATTKKKHRFCPLGTLSHTFFGLFCWDSFFIRCLTLRSDIWFVSVGRTDPCKTIECSDHQQCIIDEVGEASCKCPLENECDENVNDPVCGNDWRDYPNPCHVRKASCSSNQNIIVKYKGMCGEYWLKLQYFCSKTICFSFNFAYILDEISR